MIGISPNFLFCRGISMPVDAKRCGHLSLSPLAFFSFFFFIVGLLTSLTEGVNAAVSYFVGHLACSLVRGEQFGIWKSVNVQIPADHTQDGLVLRGLTGSVVFTSGYLCPPQGCSEIQTCVHAALELAAVFKVNCVPCRLGIWRGKDQRP